MCTWGTIVNVPMTVPADLSTSGFTQIQDVAIDACIASIVRSLEEGGVRMRSTCCGHLEGPGQIELTDGRVIEIYTPLV